MTEENTPMGPAQSIKQREQFASYMMEGDLVSGEIHQGETNPEEVKAAFDKVQELAPEYQHLQDAGLIPKINSATAAVERPTELHVVVLVASGLAEVKFASFDRGKAKEYIRIKHKDFSQNPGEDVWVCCYDYIRLQKIKLS